MSSKKPKISIVVPCYNQGKYLKECLDSILAQTFHDFEVVIVNDGSTDDSAKIIRAYQKEYPFILLIEQDNRGVVAARNNAISNAQGIYIFPLDADDKISPDCLEKLYEIMSQGIYDVVYGQTDFFGAKSGRFELPLPDRYNMYRENCVVCSALYKKADWEKYGGYDAHMKNGFEDWEFWLNFIEDDKVFYRIDETLVYYRQKDESRNISIEKHAKRKLVSYVREKHKGLKRFQPKVYIPFFKKIKLILEKPFLSHEAYRQRKKENQKIVF